MDRSLRDLVRARAEGRCEYCRISESDEELAFHVEHIISRKHGGDDNEGNLALACQNCNLHKGTNLAGIDPTAGGGVSWASAGRTLEKSSTIAAIRKQIPRSLMAAFLRRMLA